ncbi:MAG TPA: GNAT family N-acetyltransferase, partial [Ktedonobacterales bacterium]
METERLGLRRFTPDDVDNLVALDGDPEVMRYLNGGEPTPRAAIERDILPGFMRSYAADGPFGVWALVERASGAFLGWVSLRPDSERSGEATLGYRLRRFTWGQGYATEAARALLGAAFRDGGVQRVTATTYQDNAASRRVMEKLGMRLARAFRYTAGHLASNTYVAAGELWDGDEVEYAITRVRWVRERPRSATMESTMTETMTKDELLRQFAAEYERLIAVAALASQRGVTREGELWGPREVVAHLAGWEVMANVRIPAIVAGIPPAEFANPRQDTMMNNAINTAFVAMAGEQSLEMLSATLRRAYLRSADILRDVDERLFQPDEYVYERTLGAIWHCREHIDASFLNDGRLPLATMDLTHPREPGCVPHVHTHSRATNGRTGSWVSSR